MKLHSTSFENRQQIPQKFGKKRENVSPQLSWADAPGEAKSFAVSVVDTHPVARGYVHWLVVDIGADITTLAEDAAARGLPDGARELISYAGPFPPSGTHEYEFTLFALARHTPDLRTGATLDQFVAATRGDVLATATLDGNFTKR